MQQVRRAYLELHFAVFLFGFTGILGELISLSELVLVWWRMFFTVVSFGFFAPRLRLAFRSFPTFLWRYGSGVGVVVALHWVFFFGAIKYSNVSVALICLATTTFFTSILEPLLLRQPFRWYEIALGLLLIPGMYFVVNSVQTTMFLGIILGILSALLAAIFSILNKKIVHQADSMAITAVELTAGWLFLSLILPFYFWQFPDRPFLFNGWYDLIFLLILSVVCTTLAFVLTLGVMKHISAFVVNLTLGLEPIYAIILAIFLFHENQELGVQFYIGAAIILLAVFGHPFLHRHFNQSIPNVSA